jgi:hypothetical protein
MRIVFAIIPPTGEDFSLPPLALYAYIWCSEATSPGRVWSAMKSRRCHIWRKFCQIDGDCVAATKHGIDNGRVIYFGVSGVRGHNSKVEQVGIARWN